MFGAKMVTEFTAIGAEVARLSPQSAYPKLSDADESTVGYLGTLPGAALDREYTSLAIDELEGLLREAQKVLDGLPRPVK